MACDIGCCEARGTLLWLVRGTRQCVTLSKRVVCPSPWLNNAQGIFENGDNADFASIYDPKFQK